MPTLLNNPAESQAPPTRPTGVVELKVTQAGHVIQQTALPVGKCTIGSSPSCQIRVTTGQLKPLQCLIIRNDDQFTVTRWGTGVLLNGAEFTTASIRTGDCLTIGDVQLELVTQAEADTEAETHPCPVALLDRMEAQVAAEVSPPVQAVTLTPQVTAKVDTVALQAEPQPNNAAEIARLQSATQQSRQRSRQLIGTLRELRDETRGLDQHVRVLSEQLQAAQKLQEHLTEELHQSHADSAQRESQFGEELDRTIAELSASYERANIAEQGLHSAQESFQLLQSQFESLTTDCKQLREAQEANAIQSDQFKQLLDERDTEIAQLREELAHVQQALAATQQELQSHNHELQQQIAEVTAERERQVAEFHHEFEQAHAAALAELEKQAQSHQSQLDSAAVEHERQIAELHHQLHQTEEVARDAIARLEAPNPLVAELESELSTLREERQNFATENHRLSEQLSEAQKRVELLEIDVRSITGEWQQAQSNATRLVEARTAAEAHVADLTAKMADLECAAAVEWSAECDQISARLAEAREHLAAQEQALTETTAERDQFAVQLSAVHLELDKRQQELADAHRQLTDLQAQFTRSEKERTQLAAELTVRDEQSAELTHKNQTAEQQAARELESREARIKDLVKEIEQVRVQAAENLRERDERLAQLTSELTEAQSKTTTTSLEHDAQIAELTSELTQIQEKALAEIDAQQARINEIAAQLSTAQHDCQVRDAEILELRSAHDQAASELANRDSQYARLTEELAQFQQQVVQGSNSSIDVQAAELLAKLKEAEEKFSATLNERELHIAELARELKQTQDQLTDCAAQGERLHELYQQAQIDLAALQGSVAAVAPAESRIAETSDLPPDPFLPSEDPRDDDEPRIVRALASVASEPALEATAEAKPTVESTSFIDRYSHLFDEETDGTATLPIPQPAPVATTTSEDLSHLDMHDDSALEAYMANMMRRVRGETSSESVTPPLAKTSDNESRAAFSNPVTRMAMLTQRVSSSQCMQAEPTAEDTLIDMETLKETSQKPPLPTSLSAMRELANNSARQAIAKHRKRRHMEGALGKLLVSVIAGFTAAYMLFTADSFTSPYFLAGCAVAVVSALWGFKLLGVFLEMVRDGINNEFTPAELQSLDDALPIDGTSDHAASAAH